MQSLYDSLATMSWLSLSLTALCTVLGMIAVFMLPFTLRRDRKMQRVGVVTNGTVVEESALDGEGICMYSIAYTVDGAKFVLETTFAPGGLSIGEAIPVRYDPKNPKRAQRDDLLMWEDSAGMVVSIILLWCGAVVCLALGMNGIF